ncbi:MAG: TonB-dependent receptor plug domain-containing protein, partial [Bacteroidales bacterium]
MVVIGYGTMKKKDLTGSVASVRKDDIEVNKSPNAALAMQGRVAGLDITQSTGQAGAGMNITMRGARSITANNAPLILVDGIEYGGSIAVTTTRAVGSDDESSVEYRNSIDLNTDDIESIDVLKDAASTAIYGSKGANGVIIITTKKGQSDKTRVSYNMYFSNNSPAYLPHIKNGAEYQQKLLETRVADAENTLWSNQAIYYNPATKQVVWNQTLYPEPWNVFGSLTVDQLVADRGLADKYELINTDPEALDLMKRGVSLDYMDLLLRNSWSQNHEFSISGGSSKSTYNLSLGYLDDKGLLRRDEMKRYNVRVSVDNKLTKSLSIGANLLYTKKDYDRKNSSIFNQAMKAGPIGILY